MVMRFKREMPKLQFYIQCINIIPSFAATSKSIQFTFLLCDLHCFKGVKKSMQLNKLSLFKKSPGEGEVLNTLGTIRKKKTLLYLFVSFLKINLSSLTVTHFTPHFHVKPVFLASVLAEVADSQHIPANSLSLIRYFSWSLA